jgi:isopenicillin N synthase-like dioxygenase
MAGTQDIPIIDLTGFRTRDPASTRRAAHELRSALEEVGFFFIVNHGVDWDLVASTYDQTRRFHALPLADKEAIKIGGSKRGYMASYGETSRHSTVDEKQERRPNLVASLFLDRDGSPRNQWPPLEGFVEPVTEYMRSVEGLGWDLLAIYAIALDLPQDYFQTRFGEPTVGLRLSHYAPLPGDDDDWGLSAHTDRSFLTLLPTNDVPGLWIRPEGADWSPAPHVPQSFLVNSGDTLRRWSNDRLLSTTHRVEKTAVDRYAIPFFMGPALDTAIEAVPTCVDAQHPARYPVITYGDLEREFLIANYGSAALLA